MHWQAPAAAAPRAAPRPENRTQECARTEKYTSCQNSPFWSYGLITNRQRAFCPEFSVSHKVKVYRGLPAPSTVNLAKKFCTFCAELCKKGAPVFRCVKRLFIIDEMALWIIRTAPKCFSGSRTLSGHPRNQPSSALRTYPCSIWFDNGVVFCANLFYMSCFLFI